MNDVSKVCVTTVAVTLILFGSIAISSRANMRSLCNAEAGKAVQEYLRTQETKADD